VPLKLPHHPPVGVGPHGAGGAILTGLTAPQRALCRTSEARYGTKLVPVGDAVETIECGNPTDSSREGTQ
jgi:hypothetical protein